MCKSKQLLENARKECDNLITELSQETTYSEYSRIINLQKIETIKQIQNKLYE